MAEEEEIFSSSIKYGGVFLFSDFYKFCYDWLVDEVGLKVTEGKYVEKIKGETKDIDVIWTGVKEVTDYFKFKINVEFKILQLKKVQAMQNNAKIDTNEGVVQIKTKGTLIRDYKGKFEHNAFKKFLRAIYEKWVISSRVNEFEDKLAGACDEFLSQAKAYLDLEGKK